MLPLLPNWLDRLFGASPVGRDMSPPVQSAGVPAVVVTGGSAGIGLAIAAEFHRRGRVVVLVARNRDRLQEAVAAVPAKGGRDRVHAIALDVAGAGAPVALQEALKANGLYAEILVNNAGRGLAGPFDTHSQTELDDLIDLNVGALTRLTRHFLPEMVARRTGGIINVASLGGYVPGPNQAAYYASKAYVCSLTEALAAELAFSGVRVAVVAPGPVETRFHAAMGTEGSLYRLVLPALTPEQTARAAVSGFFGGRTVIVPGVVNKLMAVSVAMLPHALTVPFVKLLLARR